MRSTVLSLTLFATVAVTASADGIPVDRDTGRVTEPHDRLNLTDAQRTEFAAEHRLTLTPEQHQRLTKRCPVFPAVIEEVLSYRYSDCTCCIGHPYAIVLPDGFSIAILRSELSLVTRYGVCPRPNFPLTPAKRPSAWGRFWSRVRGANSR